MNSLIDRMKGYFSRHNSGLDADRLEALNRVKLELLKGKTWRYLRYIHARQALTSVSDWSSVLVIGGGSGIAEIALAIEFPDRSFHLTDHEGASHTFKHAKAFKDMFDIQNITFGQLNILNEPKEKYDVVYSVEVLEHIKDDREAAVNMCKSANKYVFCLVPFAEEVVNSDKKKRERAFEKHEHYVVGYDEKTLTEFFPNPLKIRGCYWGDAGLHFRNRLTEMDADSIVNESQVLITDAQEDIKDSVQKSVKEAQGIWILSAV